MHSAGFTGFEACEALLNLNRKRRNTGQPAFIQQKISGVYIAYGN
jgi:hypothetical protein